MKRPSHGFNKSPIEKLSERRKLHQMEFGHMIRISQSLISCLIVFCISSSLGCKPKTPAPVTQATVAAPTEKSEVTLSNPRVTFVPPQLLKFEVNYEFVKGAPTKSYLCELNFPGTDNRGRKILEAWELKQAGVIKGAIELQSLEPPVIAFEVSLGEAEVPQNGYETISNVLTGEVTDTVSVDNDAAAK